MLLKTCVSHPTAHYTDLHRLKSTQKLPDTKQGINNACHFLQRPRRENYISHYGYRHIRNTYGTVKGGLPGGNTAVISRSESRRGDNVEQTAGGSEKSQIIFGLNTIDFVIAAKQQSLHRRHVHKGNFFSNILL